MPPGRQVFGIDLRSLGLLGKALDATLGRVQSIGNTLGRLGSQKGGVAAGGGRGVFAGTLKDFATRDEFVGRAGTIGRGLMAGRLGGSLLAFMSIEEFGRNAVDLITGKREFREVMKDQLKFLLPSVLKETLPALLDEYEIEIGGASISGSSTRLERLGRRSEIDAMMRRTRDFAAMKDMEGVRELIRDNAQRYLDSDEFKRELEDAAHR